MKERPSRDVSGRTPVLLFALVALYIVLQFSWWAWLLISKDREVWRLQQQVLNDGGMPTVPVRDPGRTVWMVAGEGGVFLLLVLLALWIIFRTVRHELALARQQKDFLLAASHELRTPIAGLKLHLQTLQRSGLGEATRNELAALARVETDRLQGLTEKILLATRLDEGHIPLTLSEVDAMSILQAVCTTARGTYGQRHVVTCSAPANMDVRSDAQALRSIMENLVENACKYAPAGTHVVSVIEERADHWELTVADEGPGVPEQERALIFRKFQRGGNEETRHTKGTGLGLYIAQRLANALGGRVEYRERPGGGSIFAATFPRT